MDYRVLKGAALLPFVSDLAGLRIEVFREWPYLYDGNLEYERGYLETYASSPESVFVLALDGGEVVGASTGIPMRDEEASFKRPFVDAGIEPDDVFYFGESVLRKSYRGRGVGKRLMQGRLDHVRSLGGFRWICFAAVDRPEVHPLKPDDYRPLYGFWESFGFRRRPDITTSYTWKQIDEAEESPKQMTFWMRENV